MRHFAKTAVLAGAIALGTGLAAHAQTKWDMPTPYTDGTFHTQNVRWFVEQVKNASNNDLDIVVHSNASLIRLPEILRAVQTGQVPIGEILIGAFANEDPMFELDNIPFFATSFEQSRALYEVSKARLEERLMRRGIRLLYSVPWTSQGFYTRQPITTAADLRGMRFRTFSPTTARMAELLGAVPTTVQAAEVPQAFATNVVQGMVTSSITGVQTKAWEFANVFTDLRAFIPRNAVIVNERAFQRLPEPTRRALLAQAAAAEARGWQIAVEAEATNIGILRQNNMNIATPSDQLARELREIGTRMIDEWAQKAGSDGQEIIAAFRARTRTN